jgi:hypothetical protein
MQITRGDMSSSGAVSGLGLCISKHMVQLMGGEIGVVSNGDSGQGSLFYFVIPLLVKFKEAKRMQKRIRSDDEEEEEEEDDDDEEDGEEDVMEHKNMKAVAHKKIKENI